MDSMQSKAKETRKGKNWKKKKKGYLKDTTKRISALQYFVVLWTQNMASSSNDKCNQPDITEAEKKQRPSSPVDEHSQHYH